MVLLTRGLITVRSKARAVNASVHFRQFCDYILGCKLRPKINKELNFLFSPKHTQIFHFGHSRKKVNRKVQGVPQSQTAAHPWHQEEEKKTKWRVQNKQTNAREAHRWAPSPSPSEATTTPNSTGENKHENKEQCKTQHETSSSKTHKATQNTKYIRTNFPEQLAA